MLTKDMLTLEQAVSLLKAALGRAGELGALSTAAFVDPGGHLRALLRMDGACWGDIDLAINKAYTAAAWRCDSGDFYADAQPGGAYFGMHFSNGQRVTTFIGGAPLYRGETLLGAVGISGGTSAQDQLCLDALREALAAD